MLVSSFVAAHSIAQQVLGAHLTDSQRADDAPADSVNSSHDQPSKKQAAAAAAPAGVGGSDGGPVAQRVLQESRAEADAALQYAHEVSLVHTELRCGGHGAAWRFVDVCVLRSMQLLLWLEQVLRSELCQLPVDPSCQQFCDTSCRTQSTCVHATSSHISRFLFVCSRSCPFNRSCCHSTLGWGAC